jgi:hypothetical protein
MAERTTQIGENRMITLELVFRAMPYVALFVAVFLATQAKTPNDLLKWQMWAILFSLAIIADRVAL